MTDTPGLVSSHGALFSTLDRGAGSLRVAVKDCIDIAGLPTMGGSAALAGAEAAPADAAVVRAVLAGDCRIVGKANMHELAYGVTGINAWTGSPVNPLYPDRVPGGSSSGSAVAVAEGLVDFAIGTDTGGSIRTPAACCGVFGLKPTFGRVSREGAWPRATSLDCIGPFARSMAMIETAMEILADDYARHDDARDYRYAVIAAPGVDAPVQAAFDAAIAGLGPVDGHEVLAHLEGAHTANMAVIAAETHAAFGHLVQSGKLGADVAARLGAAGLVDAARLADAERIRALFTQEVDALLSRYDVLVMPTMPCFPIAVAEAGDAAKAIRMTSLVRPFNLSGHPALTIPVRMGESLPIGIQVIGRRGADETVCAFGRIVEKHLRLE